MNKRDALRLKPGDEILFADSGQTRRATGHWRGRVLHVTPRGGIRVRIIEARSGGWNGSGTGPDAGETRWIPYHHVIEKESGDG